MDAATTRKQALFMNPISGSVQTWEEWCDDQKHDGFPLEDLDTLIEVEAQCETGGAA